MKVRTFSLSTITALLLILSASAPAYAQEIGQAEQLAQDECSAAMAMIQNYCHQNFDPAGYPDCILALTAKLIPLPRCSAVLDAVAANWVAGILDYFERRGHR